MLGKKVSLVSDDVQRLTIVVKEWKKGAVTIVPSTENALQEVRNLGRRSRSPARIKSWDRGLVRMDKRKIEGGRPFRRKNVLQIDIGKESNSGMSTNAMNA